MPFSNLMAVRAAILTFKNIDQRQEYQYLEASITEAIGKSLHEKFEFDELPKGDWENAARINAFKFEDAWHTRDFGLSLGLYTKQDVIIGGGYTVREPAGATTVFISVHILEIAQQKLV